MSCRRYNRRMRDRMARSSIMNIRETKDGGRHVNSQNEHPNIHQYVLFTRSVCKCL